MVADKLTMLEMEVSNVREDGLLANRALWLKREQMSYMQKARLKR